MINENQIDAALQQLFSGIEFPAAPEGLYDPLRYMIAIGGKRLRPRLCLTVYSIYKDVLDDAVLQCAAGLEVFHSFTLIHDDIMDRSPLRRNMPTVWKKWNADTAILSGDVMCIDSYRRIASAPARVLSRVMSLFTTTAAGVCEGQQMDMDFEKEQQVDMERYMQMIGLKTGVLLACSAKMGAILGGAPQQACEDLYGYGYNLGLAFQITDDYLDAFGDSEVFGKPIGGDIVQNKKSWLTIRAMEKAKGAQKEALMDAIGMPVESVSQREEKIRRVKEIYSALGVDEDAKYEILRFNARALECAGKACTGVRHETLRRFAEKLVGRSR